MDGGLRRSRIGYAIAAYPLTLLSLAVRAMMEGLVVLGRGEVPGERVDFGELREIVGFDEYDRVAGRYAVD